MQLAISQGVEIASPQGLSQIQVSGDLEAAMKVLCPDAESRRTVGLYELIEHRPYAASIGRHKCLFVSSIHPECQEGWDDRGFALSFAQSAYTVLDVTGAEAETLLWKSSNAAFASGSKSSAIKFAGQTVLLVRLSEGFRLHAPSPAREYLIEWLADGAMNEPTET